MHRNKMTYGVNVHCMQFGHSTTHCLGTDFIIIISSSSISIEYSH